MPKLRAADGRSFIDAAVQRAEEMGVAVSIAIVGPEGHLIVAERMDAAGFITPEIAIAKAYTMAAMRAMSPRFPDGLVIQQWFRERNPQMPMNAAVFTNGKMVASGGMAPIYHENELVGAYGVSGATSAQDEEIGQFARARVRWAHRPAVDDTKDSVRAHINELYQKAGIGDRI